MSKVKLIIHEKFVNSRFWRCRTMSTVKKIAVRIFYKKQQRKI